MITKIAELIQKMNLQTWMFICLGILGLVFVVGLIFSLGSGAAVRFKSVAKRSLTVRTQANFDVQARRLHLSAYNHYKRFRHTNANPKDALPIDVCITAPYASSAAKHFGVVMMAAALFAIALMFATGTLVASAEELVAGLQWAALAAVIGAGMVLRALAGFISMGIHRACMRAYNRYWDALCELFSQPEVIDGGSESYATYTATEQADLESSPFITDKETAKEDDPEPSADSDDAASETETKSTPVAEEVIASEVVSAEPEVAEASDAASEPEPSILAAEAEREEQARIQAQAADAEAQLQAARNAADAESFLPGSPAEKVLSDIELIAHEGASLSRMKEVAVALQKERAQPENKTPTRQKKLNEALASLLKSMTSATRK